MKGWMTCGKDTVIMRIEKGGGTPCRKDVREIKKESETGRDFPSTHAGNLTGNSIVKIYYLEMCCARISIALKLIEYERIKKLLCLGKKCLSQKSDRALGIFRSHLWHRVRVSTCLCKPGVSTRKSFVFFSQSEQT